MCIEIFFYFFKNPDSKSKQAVVTYVVMTVMYLYLKPDFYNLYLCIELSMGLYIVNFYPRLRCGLNLTLKDNIRPFV